MGACTLQAAVGPPLLFATKSTDAAHRVEHRCSMHADVLACELAMRSFLSCLTHAAALSAELMVRLRWGRCDSCSSSPCQSSPLDTEAN